MNKSYHVYAQWLAKEQRVLGYLLSPSLGRTGIGGGNRLKLQLKYEEGSRPSVPCKLMMVINHRIA